MLKNLVGLITGGASGLGKATAKALVKEGCKITICDLPNSAGIEVATALGPDVTFAPADIRSATEMDVVLKDMVRGFKKIDFVVNCAGISCAHVIYNNCSKKYISLKTVQRVLETNILGTINVMRLASSFISENVPDSDGYTGVIINTAGVEAFDGQIGQSVIAATSGAIASMTQPVSRDLSAMGIRVVCICVGIFDTPLVSCFPTNVKAHFANSCAFPKRMGRPEEFAATVKFIIENRYINSCVIRLDAGLKHIFA